MLTFSWPLVIVAIAGVINQSSYITFQKLILPNDLTTNLEEGGVFAAAASLAILLNLFTVAFNFAAEPFFFAHKERDDARKIYADVALMFTLAGSLIMLIILGYMDVIQLLLGRNFREGLQVVPILLASYLLLGIYYNVSAWYKLADKTLWGAWIALGGVIITVAGNFILLPTMYSIGSAWTALGCYLFMTVTCYLLGQKFYPIPYKIVRMLSWILGALAFFALMEWLRGLLHEKTALIFVVNTLLIGLFGYLVLRFESGLIAQLLRKQS
jgi:O-antigen/teichoic acid export membrane protein